MENPKEEAGCDCGHCGAHHTPKVDKEIVEDNVDNRGEAGAQSNGSGLAVVKLEIDRKTIKKNQVKTKGENGDNSRCRPEIGSAEELGHFGGYHYEANGKAGKQKDVIVGLFIECGLVSRFDIIVIKGDKGCV